MLFSKYFSCPRCYNYLIFVSGDLISCPICGLSVKVFKENGISNFKILPKIKQVINPKLWKKLGRINIPTKG
ncbi:MAG: hypothetical protein ACXABO_18180 [Promethearchaeota archaeon]